MLLVPLLLMGCQGSSTQAAPCPQTVTASPCAPADAAPTPAVVDAAAPKPPPGPPDVCSQGEANLLKLGCKDDRGRLLGGPDLHNIPWSQVCRNNAAHGVDMKPACMAAAASCTAVLSCR